MLKTDEIGQNLRDFAKEKSLSLAELSRLLGMKNPQQVQEYLRGDSVLGGEKLAKLAELGCDLNWLLNGEKIIIFEVKGQSSNVAGNIGADNINHSKINYGKTKKEGPDDLISEIEKLKSGLIAATAEIKVYKNLYEEALEKISKYERNMDKSIG